MISEDCDGGPSTHNCVAYPDTCDGPQSCAERFGAQCTVQDSGGLVCQNFCG